MDDVRQPGKEHVEQAGSLTVLAEQINVEHHQAEAALHDGLGHALEAGRLLTEAKAQVGHGQWLPWLDANFQGSKRTAQAYMRLHKEYPKLKAKAQLRLAFEYAAGDHQRRQQHTDRRQVRQSRSANRCLGKRAMPERTPRGSTSGSEAKRA